MPAPANLVSDFESCTDGLRVIRNQKARSKPAGFFLSRGVHLPRAEESGDRKGGGLPQSAIMTIHTTRYSFAILIAAVILLCPARVGAQIGEKVTDFRLTATDGKEHSLEEFLGKIVVLDFWSFKCPVSLAYDDRVSALQTKYGSSGVVIIGVASNKNESALEVRRNAENLHLPFQILMDQESALADRLEVARTPAVAILDGTGVLRYRGAIDNNKRPDERGRVPYAEQALDALLKGQSPPLSETKPFGCSIKR